MTSFLKSIDTPNHIIKLWHQNKFPHLDLTGSSYGKYRLRTTKNHENKLGRIVDIDDIDMNSHIYICKGKDKFYITVPYTEERSNSAKSIIISIDYDAENYKVNSCFYNKRKFIKEHKNDEFYEVLFYHNKSKKMSVVKLESDEHYYCKSYQDTLINSYKKLKKQKMQEKWLKVNEIVGDIILKNPNDKVLRCHALQYLYNMQSAIENYPYDKYKFKCNDTYHDIDKTRHELKNKLNNIYSYGIKSSEVSFYTSSLFGEHNKKPSIISYNYNDEYVFVYIFDEIKMSKMIDNDIDTRYAFLYGGFGFSDYAISQYYWNSYIPTINGGMLLTYEDFLLFKMSIH